MMILKTLTLQRFSWFNWVVASQRGQAVEASLDTLSGGNIHVLPLGISKVRIDEREQIIDHSVRVITCNYAGMGYKV